MRDKTKSNRRNVLKIIGVGAATTLTAGQVEGNPGNRSNPIVATHAEQLLPALEIDTTDEVDTKQTVQVELTNTKSGKSVYSEQITVGPEETIERVGLFNTGMPHKLSANSAGVGECIRDVTSVARNQIRYGAKITLGTDQVYVYDWHVDLLPTAPEMETIRQKRRGGN